MALLKVVNQDGFITWYGHWRENGRQVKKALGPTKKDAEAYLAKIRIGQREQKLGIALPKREPHPFNVCMQHWLDTYVTQHCKPSTLSGYRTAFEHYLKPTFGETDIAAITRTQI